MLNSTSYGFALLGYSINDLPCKPTFNASSSGSFSVHDVNLVQFVGSNVTVCIQSVKKDCTYTTTNASAIGKMNHININFCTYYTDFTCSCQHYWNSTFQIDCEFIYHFIFGDT